MSEIEFYNRFIDESLLKKGFRIKLIDEELMRQRLEEIKQFYNNIQNEFQVLYGWKNESKEYFLNPLMRKFDFSFFIEKVETNEICLMNISSVIDKLLHLHCFYTGGNYRGSTLAKFHLLNLCNISIKNGISEQSAHSHKYNNNAIVFYLKTGWRIEDIRKNGTQLYMKADNRLVRDRIYKMLTLEK